MTYVGWMKNYYTPIIVVNGLNASETVGMGCDHCRILFKKGGETLITPNLVDILPIAKKELS